MLWCSSLASSGAQWMERVATGWLALTAGDNPLAVGIVFAARMLPGLFLGLAAGTVADRGDRRRQLQATAAFGVVLAVLLARLAGDGVVLWQVATIALLSGCVQVFDVPARQALIHDTVGPNDLPSAVAINAIASRLFGAVGALSGGVAIQVLGVSGAYAAVAVAHAAGLLFVSFVQAPRAVHSTTGSPTPFGRALAEAARLILHNPAVRTLVLASMACEVFAFSHMTAVPVLSRDVLRAGADGLGALTAASAIGGTLAVVVLAGVPGRVRREPMLGAVYVLYALGLTALALSPTLTLALAAMLVVGACASAFDALQQTMLQLAVPPAQRGRAAGIWILSISTAPAGHLEVGLLATLIGAPTTLLVNGALVALGALALLARAPAFRPSGIRLGAAVGRSGA